MHGVCSTGSPGCHTALSAPWTGQNSEGMLPGQRGDDAVPSVRTGPQWSFLHVQPMVLGLCAPLCLYTGGDVA